MELGLRGAEVFCKTTREWMDAEIVSVEHDCVMAEFDLGRRRCRKKLFNGSRDLILPAAERRRLEAFQAGLRPEDSDDSGMSESEGAAGRARRPERADRRVAALGSEEYEESGVSSSDGIQEIDPGACFADVHEARGHALDYIRVKQEGSTELQRIGFADADSISEPERASCLASALEHSHEQGLTLVHHKHHSFVILQQFRGAVEVHYHGQAAGDILLKVYILEGDRYDDWESYVIAESGGCGTPTYIHSTCQRGPIVVRAPCGGPFFIGLMVHRDLNADWLWKMGPDKLRQQLSRCTTGGWRARDEPEGRTTARGTDYVLSWSARDADENNELARRLTRENVEGPHGNRPISFCTDRTLGFGQHLVTAQADETELAGLYLAKHGFGRSVRPGAWFDDYMDAVHTVNYGMLIVRDSQGYMFSAACVKEACRVPEDKIYLIDRTRFDRGGHYWDYRPRDANKLRIASLSDLRAGFDDGRCSAENLDTKRSLFIALGQDELAVAARNRADNFHWDGLVRLFNDGPCESAEQLFEQALDELEGLGDAMFAIDLPLQVRMDLADLHHVRGDLSRAEAVLGQAERVRGEIEKLRDLDPQHCEWLALSRGLLSLSLGRCGAAAAALRELAAHRLQESALPGLERMMQPQRLETLQFLFLQLGREMRAAPVPSLRADLLAGGEHMCSVLFQRLEQALPSAVPEELRILGGSFRRVCFHEDGLRRLASEEWAEDTSTLRKVCCSFTDAARCREQAGIFDGLLLLDAADVCHLLCDIEGAEVLLKGLAEAGEGDMRPLRRERLALSYGIFFLWAKRFDVRAASWLRGLAASRLTTRGFRSFQQAYFDMDPWPDVQVLLHLFVQFGQEFWGQWGFLPSAAAGHTLLTKLGQNRSSGTPEHLLVPEEWFAFKGWAALTPEAQECEARSKNLL